MRPAWTSLSEMAADPAFTLRCLHVTRGMRLGSSIAYHMVLSYRGREAGFELRRFSEAEPTLYDLLTCLLADAETVADGPYLFHRERGGFDRRDSNRWFAPMMATHKKLRHLLGPYFHKFMGLPETA